VKAFYKDHPAEFIHDWGMTFDPRNVEIGLEAQVPFLLFPEAGRVHRLAASTAGSRARTGWPRKAATWV
jgi:hypothetical protein